MSPGFILFTIDARGAFGILSDEENEARRGTFSSSQPLAGKWQLGTVCGAQRGLQPTLWLDPDSLATTNVAESTVIFNFLC